MWGAALTFISASIILPAEEKKADRYKYRESSSAVRFLVSSFHIRHHYFIKRETWEVPAGKAIYTDYCTVTAHTYENKVRTLIPCQDVTGNHE